MTSALSNWLAGQILATYLQNKTGLYLALHLSDPTAAGLLASEAAGGGYVRQPISFAPPSAKACASSNPQVFTGLIVMTVTYLAVWDNIAQGNMQFSWPLATPIVTTASGQILCAAGDVALQL